MKRWPTKPLAEIASVVRGVSFDKSQVSDEPRKNSIPILRAGNIQESLLTDSDLVYVPEELVSEEQRMRRGDLAICMSSGSPAIVGKTAHLAADWPGSVGAFCAIVRFNANFHHRFGSYWFRSPAFLQWRDSNAKGANIQNIRRAELQRLPVPVPPLAEQERIVKLLDEADALRKLRAQADRRTAALLPALFHEMFGDPVANPKNWPRHKLPVLCEGKEGIKAGPFGSSLKKDCYTSEGPRVYGQEQVIAGDFSIGDYHISEAKFSEMSAYAVKSGDLLISLVGTIGKVVVVPDGIERGIINPRLLRVRPRTGLLHPCYLTHVLTSPSIIQFFGSVATGITMGVLNAGLLKRLDVPLPTLPLQKEFAQRVAEIRELEAGQAASRQRLKALFQSLLHRAFNGEL